MDLLEIPLEVSKELLGRDTIMWLMAGTDFVAGFVALYIFVLLTGEFGLGSLKQRFQLLHRIGLFLLSVSFEYHAESIIVETGRHGLSTENLVLHIAILIVMVTSTVWVKVEQRIHRRDPKGSDGGVFTGPHSSSR